MFHNDRYYEDLQCHAVDEILKHRISSGEKVTLPYGKLMERLLTFRMIQEEHPSDKSKAAFTSDLIPLAQERLNSIK